MNTKNLYDFYEKTYFHEMQVRHNLAGRVQINFALVITAYASLSYMTRMIDFNQNHPVIGLFIVSAIFCIVLTGFCVKNLIKAFWNNVYSGMPTPLEIDLYRQNLVKYKIEIDDFSLTQGLTCTLFDIDKKMFEFMSNKLRDCTTNHTEVNEKRSEHIHLSFKWLLYASIPFLISSLLFITGDLDASSPRKETPISNVSLNQKLIEVTSVLTNINKSINELKGSNMPENTTPVAPSAPVQPEPRRNIQDDRPKEKM